jgi:hypothetical protein
MGRRAAATARAKTRRPRSTARITAARAERLRRWCVVASGLFTLLGVAIALGATGPALDLWFDAFGRRFFPSGPTPEILAVRDFLLGPLGATIAARWLLMAWLFHEPIRRGEAWAHRAATWSLWGWFALEAGASAWQRAWFNVVLIDVWPMLLVGLPLYLMRAPASRA